MTILIDNLLHLAAGERRANNGVLSTTTLALLDQEGVLLANLDDQLDLIDGDDPYGEDDDNAA